jgi:serine/threonine-protein kinase HipA
MSEIAVLDVLLYNQPIAGLTNLPGDRNILTFHQEYIKNPLRPTLSLSFQDKLGDLIIDTKPTRTRLSPFFANLLPEGHMREYLASQSKINPEREFFLLAALGKDLPGALQVFPSTISSSKTGVEYLEEAVSPKNETETTLRFSLAGIQLKFSAILERDGGLTIPADGTGGAWIVKLPSAIYPGVPENEYVMMELARNIGINVPETNLIPIDQIKGIPKGVGKISNYAFITKRFDRTPEGSGIHMEDFAQVFGVYPERKYRAASYRNIAEVIFAEIGEKGIIEFIRRFVFNALIGNGDMHLKNWSLIYPDKIKPFLAPAYDFVSTIPYLPDDEMALTFVDSKAFHSLTYEQFSRFAAKTRLPNALVLETVRTTVQNFTKAWCSIGDFSLDTDVIKTIDRHLKTIPIYYR